MYYQKQKAQNVRNMFKSTNNRLFCLFLLLTVLIIVLLFLLNKAASEPPFYEVELKTEFPAQFDPPNYKRKLFNLTLSFIATPKIKCRTDSLAIIIVTSYFGNVETRSAMRRAFTQNELQQMGVYRVFLLGQAPRDNYTKQAAIISENERFGDLIQGNFIEAYRNLTYKHLMGLKWASEECPAAKYLIKMDDDIVVDLVNIVKFLGATKLPSRLLAGYILRGMVPKRDPVNKWYVTRAEYEHPTYPTFISGWFYVTTPQIAAQFYLLSHHFKYFWIDDVYVTGTLAGNLHLKHYDLSRFFTVHPEFLQCCINDIKKRYECGLFVGPNGGDNNLFYTFNQAVRKCEYGQCREREKPLNETCVAERKTHLHNGNAIIEKYKLH